MSDFKEVVIAGLARNVSGEIMTSYNALSKAFKFFDTVKWLIIESDSTDNTIKQLENIKQNNKNFNFQTMGNLEKNIPKRTERIAYCRNKYLEYIFGSTEYINTQYVVIADLDGVNNDITEDGVKSCWEINDWQVCTANQNGPYYDIWALKHENWNPSDCWKQYTFMKQYLSDDWALILSVAGKMIRINESQEPINVQSAFGGLAIYNIKSLSNKKYNGLDVNGEQICEHLSLNKEIVNCGGKVKINPKLINCSVNEHTSKYLKFLKGIERTTK
jgi:hypothetical protein